MGLKASDRYQSPLSENRKQPKSQFLKKFHDDLCVITLSTRFLIACPEKQTSNPICSYSFCAITLKLSGYVLASDEFPI